MRTTVNLDDDLVATAREMTGIEERSELLRVALKTLIHFEASQRAIALGGTDPGASVPPRRRPRE